MSEKEDNKKTKATQIGIHSVRNFLGNPQQLGLFSDQPVKFGNEYGIEVDGKIDRFGMDLTNIQMRVMEGILRGFSETNYKGNIPPEDKDQIAQQKYAGKLPAIYKYIRDVPRLRVTQKQIIEWSGLNTGSVADRQRALEALFHLGTKQYCYYYNRLAYDEEGRPERDKNGNLKKEAVDAVDTLFTIKTIREEVSLKQTDRSPAFKGEIKYYEITPSAVFLDQRETYFILIPCNWRDEIDALYKRKKYSAYIPKFIYFLRLQYELKRRANSSRPFQIRWSTEEIAIALNMPKSVYKGQRERMNKLLEEAFAVTKKLGYLQDYERTGTVDILTLQDSKFISGKSLHLAQAIEAMSNNASPLPAYLFDLFHKAKRELNEYHKIPEGREKDNQLEEFTALLAQRKLEDVEALIKWGLSIKFWCDRLSTPHKLRENFDAGWSEMNATKTKSSGATNLHKKIGIALQCLISSRRPDIEIALESSGIEIRSKGAVHVVLIEYAAKDFRMKIETFLQKIQIPLEHLGEFLKEQN